MLLLIKKSILIIEYSYEEVSICTLALKALLQPYTQHNAIIPSLYQDIIDLFSSLVPYIISIVSASEESVKKIENNIRMKAYIDKGLTVINLTSQKISQTISSEIYENKLIHSYRII